MLDGLFSPGSVAVIGASTKELSIGNRIIKNLLDFGYKGNIYPINPKANEVRGVKAYPNVVDVPGPIELAHIVIPGKYVPFAIDDCGKKGVKFVIINTAGFRETGAKGVELENEVLRRAHSWGIRVFGPNCQGIINTDPGIQAYCNFTFTMPRPGNISIVAQSGGVAEVINQRFSQLGAGVRMYASNGNACDISIPEIIRYWGNDPGTRVIVLYVESISDPVEFMEATREVTVKKPILAMKSGRTEEGARAASSHTGGLAGKRVSTELMFRKTGVLSFTDEEELCQSALAFATQPIPSGNGVGMLTNTGGPAIIATDELVEAGMKIPDLSPCARAELKEKLYSAASVNNPVDVLATANATHFGGAMDILMNEAGIDSLYINFVTPFFVDNESIAREIVRVNQQASKPIICNLMTDNQQWGNVLEILRQGGVPCYSFPETAARALVSLSRYNEVRSASPGCVALFDVEKEKAEGVLSLASSEGRKNLSAGEVYEILSAYKIPLAPWGMASNAEQAKVVADDIGYPVVVKVDSDKIIHKSDRGGVALDLKNAAEVDSAVGLMISDFGPENVKFLVQKYLPLGEELIVGAKKEGKVGHLLMFGMGGTYVEILKDVAFELTPVTSCEAERMVSSIKLFPVLYGYRGKAGVDIPSLIETVQRISQLVTDLPVIQEMDLNPVMALADGVCVVDARMSI